MKKIIFFIASIGFTLNFIWENLHSVLYANVDPLMHILPYYLPATIGDVIAILFFYWLMTQINKNRHWIYDLNFKNTLWLLLFGGILGIVLEIFFMNLGLWSYSSSMPIIPGIDVGLSPVLQMMFLPLLTFYLTKKLIQIK